METNHKECIVKLPEHLAPYRENKETVCIDVLILGTMLELWRNKIITLGCCQEYPGRGCPAVVISGAYDYDMIDKIFSIISNCDDRKWVVLQWKDDLLLPYYKKEETNEQ